MSDDEYPLWPPEVIDRLRVCNVEPHYRRRWRDRVRVFGEDIGGPTSWVTLSLSLTTATTDGRRPSGDDDELLFDLCLAEAYVLGLGVLVSPRLSRWLVDRGVVRY